MSTETTMNESPEAAPGAHSPAPAGSEKLLAELWSRLKLLDEHCTDSMAVAMRPRSFDCIEGQRMAFREIQNWLLAHGYSPNP